MNRFKREARGCNLHLDVCCFFIVMREQTGVVNADLPILYTSLKRFTICTYFFYLKQISTDENILKRIAVHLKCVAK